MSKQFSDFLLEIGTEELPPKLLPKLAKALHQELLKSIDQVNLKYSDSEWFATPRRLAVRIFNLQVCQEDKNIERLGPAVQAAFHEDGSAKPAAIGFAQSCGIDVNALKRIETPKGMRLAAQTQVKGKSAQVLLPECINTALSKLPITRAMRWGAGEQHFIRPVHWLVVLMDDSVVPMQILGCVSDNLSQGHRFHVKEPVRLTSTATYEQQLHEHHVIVSFEERKANIREQLHQSAEQLNATVIIDEDLLEEVTALVEWPVALVGQFDSEFLSVPPEALIATMSSDQKYFHCVDNHKKLLPCFITISNIDSTCPQTIIKGNERVIRPRLADAKFFYDTDCKQRLSDYENKLSHIIFQKKLGTLQDKALRVSKIAQILSQEIGCKQQDVEKAAKLFQCDLMTNMVYEFPELQGIMGYYYAKNDGESEEIAAAIKEVYLPKFSGDSLPESQTGIALAIANRLDTLVGIFGIGQMPTGTKDPFALRRAALGLIRILVEKEIDCDLFDLIEKTITIFTETPKQDGETIPLIKETQQQLLDFFMARGQAWYQENKVSMQVIHSVYTLKGTNPFDNHKRLMAVDTFNTLPLSESLSSINKRVSNILSKSDINVEQLNINKALFEETEEKNLFNDLEQRKEMIEQNSRSKHYDNALATLTELKPSVDAFFDKVMVNTDNLEIKHNRLALLYQLRQLFLLVADISLLQK